MKQADVLSVRSLLSGPTQFRTAQAHRGFVWGPTEVAQLFVDLEIAARDTANDDEEEEDDLLAERFYLGAISVSPVQNGVFILHDGHQRLATVAMMLAFIRDRVRKPGASQRLDRMLVRRSIIRPPKSRLRLAPEAHAWYSHFILPPGATKRMPSDTPIGSPRELLLAARFMEQAFTGYRDDDLLNLADFATKKTAVVRTLIGTDAGITPRSPTQRRIAPRRRSDRPVSHYGIAAE